MQINATPRVSQVAEPQQPLPAQLKALRRAHRRSLVSLAERTGLSRLTVAAAEGQADARLSTLTALFDELGYTLVPVPKALLAETVAFIANQGQSVSLPAGISAPLGVGQQAFRAAAGDLDEDEAPS
ncbi:helix-turn-helix transcriptional regulator [Rhizobacter sp. SG703]|uniref:helix-turn-helix domain-containing protein n=1 Tax=Rhizobacter sp. SG703 TaxID=2587140 RepID=UPI0014454695|nr:helix-turn-helix transcriptional regulator [Rhizobacter sp. SG703]NKI93529.1 transcriptional regulator with XRE-family HTH domain [Rhizobacter sp. SG703]